MATETGFNADDLVYWRGDVQEPSLEELEEKASVDDVKPEGHTHTDPKSAAFRRYPSMYVSLCEDMIQTVLYGESFLFSEVEQRFLATVCALPYESKFLLFRLLFRKPDQWFRLDKLNYVKELGSLEAVQSALVGLCEACRSNSDTPAEQEDSKASTSSEYDWMKQQTEIIDLTLDEDEIEIDVKFSKSHGPPSLDAPSEQLHPPSTIKENASSDCCSSGSVTGKATDELDLFVQDEQYATLEDLIACLNVEEMKVMAKTLKITKVNLKRGTLMKVLLSTSSSQATLHHFLLTGHRALVSPSPKISLSKKNGHGYHGKTHKRRRAPQSGVLRELIMKELKKCIRLSSAIYTIFRRLHIIFFRSAMIPVAILTPALLVRCRKRHYSSYMYERTFTIFSSRENYLAYEKALELEAEITALSDAYDELVVGGQDKDRMPSRAAKTPMNEENKENSGSIAMLVDEDAVDRKVAECRSNSPETKPQSAAAERRIHIANGVVEIFNRVYPRWQELVKLVGEEKGKDKGLERFDEGWVLTKIVFRGAEALADLKAFRREADLLEELLGQKRWWRGRRGKWYERLALVYMAHMGKEVGEGKRFTKRDYLKKAMDVVTRGLEDRDTHIVYRRMLEARRFRLEKRLKVPEEKHHPFEDVLYTASKVYVKGTRIHFPTWSVEQEKAASVTKPMSVLPFAPVKPRTNSAESSSSGRSTSSKSSAEANNQERKTGKSVWLGRNNEEVNVETLALQHYEEQGFKGFHSEGRVVHMIFGLLFWDIIFASIPGAFETPYQSAPLDIADCFYQSRESEIETRLSDICADRGAEILEDVFNENEPKGTWCIGVRWDTFEIQDLVEIVKCLGGQGLYQICRLLCEDYVGRSSGVPDLLVWNGLTGDCKFVEVKGPGDRLQKNQEIWIDAMIRAGVSVEVCHVGDQTDYIQIESAPRRRRYTGRRKSAVAVDIEPETEEEDNDLNIDDEAANLPLDPVEVQRSPKRQKTSTAVIDLSGL